MLPEHVSILFFWEIREACALLQVLGEKSYYEILSQTVWQFPLFTFHLSHLSLVTSIMHRAYVSYLAYTD